MDTLSILIYNLLFICGLLVVYYFKHAVRAMKVSIETGNYCISLLYSLHNMHNTEEIIKKKTFYIYSK